MSPNLRKSLWYTLDNAKKQVEYGLRFCDVLKISDNEIQWFTGEKDYDKGIQILKDTYDIPLIILSMGREGSRAYYRDKVVEVPAFANAAASIITTRKEALMVMPSMGEVRSLLQFKVIRGM